MDWREILNGHSGGYIARLDDPERRRPKYRIQEWRAVSVQGE